jgi:SP family general alpha glucoside:H+ symporter-like MFS transporter
VPGLFFLVTFLSPKPANMDNVATEKSTSALEFEEQPASRGEHVYDDPDKVGLDRTGAINAEDIEHKMTVLQAAKAYPAASWWAFVMSCTIVSSCSYDRQAGHFSNAAIDHGVILRFLDGTVHSHSSVRQGFWCMERREKRLYYRSFMAVSIPV